MVQTLCLARRGQSNYCATQYFSQQKIVWHGICYDRGAATPYVPTTYIKSSEHGYYPDCVICESQPENDKFNIWANLLYYGVTKK